MRQGFLREASAAFIARLGSVWPDWNGSALPEALASCVRIGSGCVVRHVRFNVRCGGQLRYVVKTARAAERSVAAPNARSPSVMPAGDTYSAIAASLVLSPATVRNHIAHCFRELPGEPTRPSSCDASMGRAEGPARRVRRQADQPPAPHPAHSARHGWGPHSPDPARSKRMIPPSHATRMVSPARKRPSRIALASRSWICELDSPLSGRARHQPGRSRPSRSPTGRCRPPRA